MNINLKVNTEWVSLWSVLNDVFKEAQHAGEVDPGYNPALAVKNPIAKVKRAD
jgi:hypothetical protein